MKTDHGEYGYEWDSALGVVTAYTNGIIEEFDATNINTLLKKFADEHGPIKVIIDVSKLKKMTSGCRKVFSEATDSDWLVKMGLYGGSTTVRVIVNFIWAASGQSKKMKQFKNKQEAIAWLK